MEGERPREPRDWSSQVNDQVRTKGLGGYLGPAASLTPGDSASRRTARSISAAYGFQFRREYALGIVAVENALRALSCLPQAAPDGGRGRPPHTAWLRHTG